MEKPKTVLQCLNERRGLLAMVSGLYFLYSFFLLKRPISHTLLFIVVYLAVVSVWYYIRENYLNPSAS